MTNIDDLERSILDDARTFIEPDPADQARVLSKLTADLGLAGVATASAIEALRPIGTTTRLGQAVVSRKLVAISFALLGAGAGFGAGFVVGQRSGHVPTSAHVSVPTTSVEAHVAAVGQPASSAQIDDTTEPARDKTAPVAPTAKRAVMSEPSAGSLDEELALLRRAERAIRSGNGLLALGLLRELDQRFPSGQLLEERRAAKVMASCQGLQPEARRRMGEAYLRRATNSVYDERVRQLCGMAETLPNQNGNSSEKGLDASGD